jgi:hypothetical protein
LISLLWAAMGCALTIWSRRSGSRPLWIAGATLLIATAVKMMLLDFGSLGQLTNILAVIAAGVVFLAVGWLAPMPPAAAKGDSTVAERGPSRIAVLIAITIGLFETAAWYHKSIPQQSRWSLAPAPIAAPAPITDPEPVTQPAEQTQAEEAVAAPEAAAEADLTEEAAAPAPIPAPAPAKSPESAPSARNEYVRPPVVDATGTANYNDYSYPVRKARQDSDPGNGKFNVPPSPGDSDQGVDTLLRQGRIVQATRKDLDEYLSTVRGDPEATTRLRQGNRMTLTQPLWRTYLARREFTLPTGLYGAHMITVIVPPGVTRPYGNPGHSQILEYPQDR